MKEIFQEFGTAIIAIITAIGVLGLVFGVRYAGKTGLLEITGMFMTEDETNYTSYRDYEAVKNWHEREKPQVFFVNSEGRFFAEESVEFLKKYYVKDMEGEVYYLDDVVIKQKYPDIIFAEVCDIRDENDLSVMELYDQSKGYICFDEAGIYDVYFRVIDKENVEETWRIPIVVDVGGV